MHDFHFSGGKLVDGQNPVAFFSLFFSSLLFSYSLSLRQHCSIKERTRMHDTTAFVCLIFSRFVRPNSGFEHASCHHVRPDGI